MPDSYEIIVSEKIKRMTIAEAYEYIEAFQSFEGDWPLYLAPRELMEGEREYEVEAITPIPSTHGAVCILEFYLDEELAAKVLSEKLGPKSSEHVKRALEAGVPLHRAVPPAILEEMEEYSSLIKGFRFEAAIPLTRRVEEVPGKPGWIDEHESIEVDLFLIDPDKVKRELDKSLYVGEYLRRLERLSSKCLGEKGWLLLLRGEDACISLESLEKKLGDIVRQLPARRGAMMYTRIVPLS